jgi:hypothetical protein
MVHMVQTKENKWLTTETGHCQYEKCHLVCILYFYLSSQEICQLLCVYKSCRVMYQ